MGRSQVVVAFDTLPQNATNMCFVQDQDVIEAFFSDGAYPSFSKGVGIGCLVRGANDLHACGAKN